MFNIDFNNIIQLMLPPFLRKPKNIEWLKALVKPVIDLYIIFYAYRTQTLYSLCITGQVIYLEKLLNDKFNNGNVGIYIADGSYNNAPFLYNTAEARPDTFIYKTSEGKPDLFLYNTAEYMIGNDFIVMVPVAITFDSNEMKSLINLYKLAGKQYSIQTY